MEWVEEAIKLIKSYLKVHRLTLWRLRSEETRNHSLLSIQGLCCVRELWSQNGNCDRILWRYLNIAIFFLRGLNLFVLVVTYFCRKLTKFVSNSASWVVIIMFVHIFSFVWGLQPFPPPAWLRFELDRALDIQWVFSLEFDRIVMYFNPVRSGSLHHPDLQPFLTPW